ncbi:hypothetical protein YB2330_004800 [Saitoella coloradoensis]
MSIQSLLTKITSSLPSLSSLTTSSRFPTTPLASSGYGPSVARIALRIDGEVTMETLTYAADMGMTFWEVGEGGLRSVGAWLAAEGEERRREVFLAGAIPTFPKEMSGTEAAVEALLDTLNTSWLDLLYVSCDAEHATLPTEADGLTNEAYTGRVRYVALVSPTAEELRHFHPLLRTPPAVRIRSRLDVEKAGDARVKALAEAAKDLGVALIVDDDDGDEVGQRLGEGGGGAEEGVVWVRGCGGMRDLEEVVRRIEEE